MKYGTISQLQNIARWLQNYVETGNRLCDITENTSNKQFKKNERKLRADNFNPPDQDIIKRLIDEIQTILQNYHENVSLENVQQEWHVIRPRLTSIFHEDRVLPEIIYPRAIVEKTPYDTREGILSYLICKLEKIKSYEGLVIRLNKGDDSAYSEAILATYFLQMGLDVRLEPVIESGRKNDVSVKVNSEWVNIEVKTPQKSQLQEELLKILDELVRFVHKLPLSRDVYVFLTKEPSIKEQKAISDKILELALCEDQPVVGKVNDIAFIRTENLSFKPRFVTPTRMIGCLNTKLPFPTSLIESYNTLPMLFLLASKFDTREDGINVNFTIYAPFEDSRIIALITKKRKQLSPNSMNMVAFDTTHIPIIPDLEKQYRWEKRLRQGLKTKVSRRIGAVLLFSRLQHKDKISLKSSLFVHPNPYKRLPSNFLKKCDLNSYELSKK